MGIRVREHLVRLALFSSGFVGLEVGNGDDE